MQTVNHGIILQRACFPCITGLYKALNRLFFLLIDQSDQDISTALMIIVPTIGPSIFFSLIFLSSPHSLFFPTYLLFLTVILIGWKILMNKKYNQSINYNIHYFLFFPTFWNIGSLLSSNTLSILRISVVIFKIFLLFPFFYFLHISYFHHIVSYFLYNPIFDVCLHWWL